MNIAICYWGQIRTLNKTYPSHEKYIFNVLQQNNISYDIYMHTWKESFKNDFMPDLIKCKVDEQQELINEIDNSFSEYWHEDIYKRMGGDSLLEWIPTMVKNGLYGMESLKRVTQLCIDQNIEYDLIIYIRPDLELLTEIPVQLFQKIYKSNNIIVPKDHWGSKDVFGINDVFSIVPFENCKNYAFRIDKAKFYRKNIGRIAGEHYLGWIVSTFYNEIIYFDVNIRLIR